MQYITLAQARQELRTDHNTADFNERVYELVSECGRVLESLCNRRFDHTIATYRYDYKSVRNGGDIDGRELLLRQDCQAMLSVTNGDGTVIAPSDYELLPDNPMTHYDSLLLDDALTWCYGTTARRAIAIMGVWGYGGRFINTLKTVGGSGVAPSDTEITLSNVTGLERGQIVRLGMEYMLIEKVVTSKITVTRAVNGSTSATYLTGAPLYLFQPDILVQRAIKRMVRWYDKLGDNPLFGTVQLGEIQVPADYTAMPKDLQSMIEQLRKAVRFMGVS